MRTPVFPLLMLLLGGCFLRNTGTSSSSSAGPALYGENLACRSEEGDRNIMGVQGDAVASGWQWLRRTSAVIGSGGASHEVEVDPTVYYVTYLTAPDAKLLKARVLDGAGSVVASSARIDPNTVRVYWSSNAPAHWKLEWNLEGVQACVYVLSTAKKKGPP